MIPLTSYFSFQSFELVEQILKFLETAADVDNQDYIAINHVRDNFIPPRDRKAKSEIWKRAVEFIDSHESRVSFSITCFMNKCHVSDYSRVLGEIVFIAKKPEKSTNSTCFTCLAVN